MNYFIIIITILGLLSGCSHPNQYSVEEPELNSINIVDRNGFTETICNKDRLEQFANTDFLQEQPYEKVLRVYNRDCLGNINAYLTSYHPNGLPKQYLEIVNGRANGFYKEWYSNGKQKIEIMVVGGEPDIIERAQETWLFDATGNVWDEDGSMMATFCYSNGELQGPSIYFHSNGKVWKKICYSQNLAEGDFEIYTADGQLLQVTRYVQNEPHGPAMRYWPDGSLACDEEYRKGQLFAGRYYNMAGDLVSHIANGSGYKAIFAKEAIQELQEFQNGKQEGEVRVFGKEGKLINRYFIKNDLKQGEELVFYESNPQKVQLSINWNEGKAQGLVKTWYPNGVQESQREMSENLKNGMLTAWYLDGSLMMIEQYEKDKLIEGRYFIQGEHVTASEVRGGKGTATIYDSQGNFLRKIAYENSKIVE